MTSPLAAAAAILVGLALFLSYGTFDPWALALVTAGAAAAVAAALTGAPGRRGAARAVLLAGAGAGLASHVLRLPDSPLTPAQHPYFVSLAWTAVAASLTYLLPGPSPAVRRWRFPVLLACFCAMGAVVIASTGFPGIDVWMFQQGGAQALLRGRNPYELAFPNIYRDATFYGPGFLAGGKVVVFPYPPLTALLDVPAFLLGDVRWLGLASMAAAGWLVRGLSQEPEAELAALLILFQPRSFFVLRASWTEPLVLAAWAATLLLARRWQARAPAGWAAAGVAAGFLLASKQYTPLLALPVALAAPRAGVWKAALAALAVLAAITVPFALWNPHELWRDVVVAQFLQPFRMDALSWPAAWARWRGGQPGTAIAFVLAAAVLAAGLLRRAPSLQRAAAIAGASFLVLLLFNKQAFCNYYWLAAGILASASALPAAPAT